MNAIEVCQEVLAGSSALHCARLKPGEPGQYEIEASGRLNGIAAQSEGWTLVDPYSASVVLAVYNALQPDEQAKFTVLPLPEMINLALDLLARAAAKRRAKGKP